jgi:hypothetical protein
MIRDTGNLTNGYDGLDNFPWGYVDIYGRIDFHIGNARRQDGSPANLPWIDFVKVQTATFRYGGLYGEVSTEKPVKARFFH